jgi:hypothetical protein
MPPGAGVVSTGIVAQIARTTAATTGRSIDQVIIGIAVSFQTGWANS